MYLLFVDLSKTPLQLPCWLEIVIPRNLRDPRPVRLLRSSTYVKDLVQLFRLQQQKKQKTNKAYFLEKYDIKRKTRHDLRMPLKAGA